MAELEEILEHVALANRMLYEMDLADSSTIERGHVSYRLPDEPDKFVIKGWGPALSMTEAEHMVIVDMAQQHCEKSVEIGNFDHRDGAKPAPGFRGRGHRDGRAGGAAHRAGL